MNPEPLTDAAARARIDTDLEADLLVSAGAGSGKTSKLVDRYMALLRAGVEPQRIVVVTFTRKAAAEMKHRLRQRLRELADQETGRPWRDLARRLEEAPLETIDAFCLRLLRSEALAAGLDPGFEILGEAAQELLPRESAVEVVRRGLWADDPAARELLDRYGQFETVIDTLTGALGLVKLWRDPFAPPPASPTAAGMIDYLAGRRPEPPAPEEIEALLASGAAAVAEQTLATLRSLPQLTDLRDRLAELAEHVPADDKWLPGFRAGQRLLEAVAGDDRLALLAALEGLDEAPSRGGSDKAWGRPLAPARQALKALRDWRDGAGRALWNEPEEIALAARATAALLPLLREAEATLARTQARLGALGFRDLILRAAQLLTDPAAGDVLERVRRRYEHFLVDEFQDTDGLQEAFFRHLAGGRPGAFFAVGDDKQSIYAFRGADVSVFNRVRRNLGSGNVTLATTFRLDPPLAETLNHLFGHPSVMGPEEHSDPSAARFVPLAAVPHPERAPLAGKPVELLLVNEPERRRRPAAEAETVAEHVLQLHESGPVAWRDIALLFRAGTHMQRFREALLARGIPVACERGELCRRQEVADLLALARWLETPLDPFACLSLLRSPLVGLTDDDLVEMTADRPLTGAVQSGPLGERLNRWRRWRSRRSLTATLRRIVAETGAEAILAALPDADRRLANLEKVLDELERLEAGGLTGAEALELLELRRDRGAREDPEGSIHDAEADAVSLFTVHKAKGLERRVIYVVQLDTVRSGRNEEPPVGVFDGAPFAPGPVAGEVRLPLAVAPAAEPRGPLLPFEQERLLYVACTRAEQRLILVGSPGEKDGVFAPRDGSWLQAVMTGLGWTGDACAAPGVRVTVVPAPSPATVDRLSARRQRLAALATAPHVAPPPTCGPRSTGARPVRDATSLARAQTPAARGPAVIGGDRPIRGLAAWQRGTIIHDLLRLAALNRQAPRIEWLIPAAAAFNITLAEAAARDLLEAARGAWERPEVAAALASPTVLVETPFLHQRDGQVVQGRVDLAGIDTDLIRLIDYKTGSADAGLLAEYERETSYYAAALAARWPGRRVERWLIFVDAEPPEARRLEDREGE